MKKIYALAAVAALAIGGISYAAVGDVVFQSSLSTPSDAPGDGWSRVNGGDVTTFATFGTTGHGNDKQLRIWKNVDGISQNDWLVSPKLTLEAGKTYEATCWFKFHAGTSMAAHVGLHHTTVYPTVDGLDSNIASSSALEQYNDVNGDSKSSDDSQYLTSWTKLSGKFTAGAEDNYVAFHVCGEYKGGIYVSDFSVVEAEGAVTPVDPPVDPIDPDVPHECTGIQLPYSSAIATSNSTYDEAWTVINVNGDAAWSPTSESSFKSGMAMKIQYNTSKPMDDWLISPAMHMEAGKEYIIQYGYATRGKDELLDVYLTETNATAEILSATPMATYEKIDTSSKAKWDARSFTPEATGDYYLSFYGHSGANKWYIWVGDVQVMENVFAPATVGTLTATPAENPALEVALSWTLPTTDAFGQEMGEDKAFEKLEIFRDGEERPIATLTEPATSFTDSEEYGLTSGKHTYSIVVTYSGAASAAAMTGPTTYVGPFEPLALPADMTVTSDMLGAWVPAYGETHAATANSWVPYNSTKPDRWRYSAKAYNADDAWIFSPEVIIPEAGYYTLEVTGSNGSTYDKTFVETYISKGQTIDSEMKPVDIDWSVFGYYNPTQTITFYASEAGNYSIATRVHIPTDDYSAFIHEIKAIKVDRGQMIPGAVSALKATAAEDESLSITLSWENPTESTAGTALEPGSFYTKVYRKNGAEFELLATLTEGESQYIDEAISESGSYTYQVETLATGTDAKLAESPVVSSSWVGPREVALPYSVQLNSTSDATRFIWEGLDGNGDGKTWGFGYYDRMVCPQPEKDLSDQDMTDYYQYQDYLLSPIFDLTPGYYEISFQMYGRTSSHGSDYNYEIAMNVGLTPAGVFLPERPEIIGKTLVTNASTSYSNKVVNIRVEEAGKYQIVFAADEINYKLYSTSAELGLGKVEFRYLPVLPGIATDLTVTPDPDGALSAVLSWMNPTTSNVEGVTPVLTQAIITRDQQEVAVITEDLEAGTIYEWTDQEIPVAGVHVYTVTLFTAEGAHTAAAPSVKSPWIGKGIEAPYSVNAGEFVDHAWDQHSPNMTTTSWGNSNCWDLTTSNGARYDKGSQDVDGYLITPKLELVHTQTYKLTVEAWKTTMTAEEKENGYPLEILVGSEGTPDSWTSLGSVAIKSYNSNVSPVEFYIAGNKDLAIQATPLAEGEETPETPVFDGSTPASAVAVPTGTQRLAFHINKNWDSGLFMFHKFAIDKEGETTGIENVSIADGITIGVNGLRFEGTATDVRIFDLSGKLIRFAAEAEGEICLEGLAKGAYIVRFALDGRPVALKIAR